jgi:ubiquitin carboxyl-terminal hydrolase 5/13
LAIFTAEINVDEAQVSQLADMGFPLNACIKAVYHTKNAGIEQAMNWVMEHMDDFGKITTINESSF